MRMEELCFHRERGRDHHQFSLFWFHYHESKPTHLRRRSSSQAGADVGLPPSSPTVLTEEERMDMLWEDFNENDPGDHAAEKREGRRRSRSAGMRTLADDDDDEAATGSLSPASVAAASTNGTALRRKQGLVAMLNMWKKLLLTKRRKSKQRPT